MMRIMWEQERQVAEASGAIAIARIVEMPKRFAGKRTVAIITGWNMDEAFFRDVLYYSLV